MFAARALILAAALLWSTGGAGVKWTALSGAQIAGIRSAIAAAVLFALVPACRKRLTWSTGWAAIPFAGAILLYVLATKRTTAANAIFLQSTAPVYVLLLSPFLLKERATRQELWSLPFFLLGLGLFFGDDLQPGHLEGNVLALGSGACLALAVMGLRKAGPAGTAAIAWGNVLCALASLPFMTGGRLPTLLEWTVLAYLGVFQIGLAYVLFTRALERLRAVEASLLMLVEPVLNPVWTWLLVGEKPGPWALAGGAVILVATGWRIVSATARPEKTAGTSPTRP